jgi:hypothetical protein
MAELVRTDKLRVRSAASFKRSFKEARWSELGTQYLETNEHAPPSANKNMIKNTPKESCAIGETALSVAVKGIAFVDKAGSEVVPGSSNRNVSSPSACSPFKIPVQSNH